MDCLHFSTTLPWSTWGACAVALALVATSWGKTLVARHRKPETLSEWQHGGLLLIVHGLALFAVDVVNHTNARGYRYLPWLNLAGLLFLAGWLLAASGLVALALKERSHHRWPMRIAVGLWLVAWVILAGVAGRIDVR